MKIIVFYIIFIFMLTSCSTNFYQDKESTTSRTLNLQASENSLLYDYIQNRLNLNNISYYDNRNLETITYSYQDYIIEFNLSLSEIKNSQIIIPYSVIKNDSILFNDLYIFDIHEDNSGILLSFDDFYEIPWTTHLYMFREANVRVTFFCKLSWYRTATFMTLAEADKHEIGYHTMNHKGINQETFEDFKTQIEAILLFREHGYPMTSFAFPHGTYSDKTLSLANEYFYKTRTFRYTFQLYDFQELISNQFISSESIDAFRWEDTNNYFTQVKNRLILTKITNKIYPCTTHNIVSNDSELKFNITEERLQYILDLINLLQLKTYTFNDFNSPDIILRTN